MPQLLLISNSTNPGEGYLDHCEDEVRAVVPSTGRLVFVPWALADLDGYGEQAEDRFRRMGIDAVSLHRVDRPRVEVAEAAAFFVGGGNTFRLVDRLARLDLLGPIREAVAGGAVYLGASAGANLACPTISTTNDMPIVEPPSFEALGLIPFQLNAHYVDRDPDVAHGGETREQRIAEFHEEHDRPVVGLREGSMLRIDGSSVRLLGSRPCRVFRRGRPPEEVEVGASLEGLLEAD